MPRGKDLVEVSVLWLPENNGHLELVVISKARRKTVRFSFDQAEARNLHHQLGPRLEEGKFENGQPVHPEKDI